MLWNKTTKIRTANQTDIGIALGAISGTIFGMVTGILVFTNLFLGLLICLILAMSFGATIGTILDQLKGSKKLSSQNVRNTSKINIRSVKSELLLK